MQIINAEKRSIYSDSKMVNEELEQQNELSLKFGFQSNHFLVRGSGTHQRKDECKKQTDSIV